MNGYNSKYTILTQFFQTITKTFIVWRFIWGRVLTCPSSLNYCQRHFYKISVFDTSYYSVKKWQYLCTKNTASCRFPIFIYGWLLTNHGNSFLEDFSSFYGWRWTVEFGFWINSSTVPTRFLSTSDKSPLNTHFCNCGWILSKHGVS